MAQAMHLSQRMSLSQVLAPQLQQSLALLQAPTLELKAMVEQELQQNPVLEESAETEMTQTRLVRFRQRDAFRRFVYIQPPLLYDW
jgi:RNA polymerase sigma-54 factor